MELVGVAIGAAIGALATLAAVALTEWNSRRMEEARRIAAERAGTRNLLVRLTQQAWRWTEDIQIMVNVLSWAPDSEGIKELIDSENGRRLSASRAGLSDALGEAQLLIGDEVLLTPLERVGAIFRSAPEEILGRAMPREGERGAQAAIRQIEVMRAAVTDLERAAAPHVRTSIVDRTGPGWFSRKRSDG